MSLRELAVDLRECAFLAPFDLEIVRRDESVKARLFASAFARKLDQSIQDREEPGRVRRFII